MTVRQGDTIDFVAHDPDHDEALLVMVQDDTWGDSGLQLPALEAKFNTYLAYVTEGRLVTEYPSVTGKRVHVQLRATNPPGERELEFLRIVAVHHLEPADIRLSWKVIGQDGEYPV
jgi:hypothetical protein